VLISRQQDKDEPSKTAPDRLHGAMSALDGREAAGWPRLAARDQARRLKRMGERIRLFTRNGNDWSELFPAVVKAVEQLDVHSCLIDGEVVVCDKQGLAVFDLLRHGSRIKHEAHLFANDVLELDGRSLVQIPLEERKYQLAPITQWGRTRRSTLRLTM
jgi:bifunctional non-homologous end joining protein LigD